MIKLPKNFKVELHLGDIPRNLHIGEAAIIGDLEILKAYFQYSDIVRLNELLKEQINILEKLDK